MLRFSLFGFPIAVQWQFWVLVLLLSGSRLDVQSPQDFQVLFICVIAVFLSFIIHELGHTFMQRHYGAQPHILLYAFGGLAIANRTFPRGPSIAISLAGPLVEIAVGFLARELFPHVMGGPWWFGVFIHDFAWICILWGVFNLVPIFPLDGGHVLLHFLGPRHQRVTYLTGVVCGVCLALYMLLVMRSIWNTILFVVLAWQNFQLYQGERPSSFLRP